MQLITGCATVARMLALVLMNRSPPARVGSSFTLVLAVVTFNVTVGNELPKLNYLTLMDWYVAFCGVCVCEWGCVL